MDGDGKGSKSPDPVGSPGQSLPVSPLTPGTPAYAGNKILWNGALYTPLEDTRQITLVDISLTPEACDSSLLVDTRSVSAGGTKEMPARRLFSPEIEGSASSACRDLLGETFWVEKSQPDTQREARGRTTRADSAANNADVTFSLCCINEENSAATADTKELAFAQDAPSVAYCDIAGAFPSGGYNTVMGPGNVSCMDASDVSLQDSQNRTVLRVPHRPDTAQKSFEAAALPEEPQAPTPDVVKVPCEAAVTAVAASSIQGSGGEAVGEVIEVTSTAALDGTFLNSSLTTAVAARPLATDVCEGIVTNDADVAAESQVTFIMSPVPAMDPPKLKGPVVEAAPARVPNASFTVSHATEEAVSGSTHQKDTQEAVFEADSMASTPVVEGTFLIGAGDAEAVVESPAANHHGDTPKTAQECPANASFTVSYDTVEAAQGTAGSTTSMQALEGTFLLLDSAAEAAAKCPAAEELQEDIPKAADPEAECRVSYTVPSASAADELEHCEPAGGEIGTAAGSATFLEPTKASGNAPGLPVVKTKAPATTVRSAVPPVARGSLPAPRFTSRLQPRKTLPVGNIPTRSVAKPGRQSSLPNRGAPKIVVRGLQRPSVSGHRLSRPLQQTSASGQKQPLSADDSVPPKQVEPRKQARPVATQRLAFKPVMQPPASLPLRMTAEELLRSQRAPVNARGTAAPRQPVPPGPSHGLRTLVEPQAGTGCGSSSVGRASTPVGSSHPPFYNDVELPTPIKKV